MKWGLLALAALMFSCVCGSAAAQSYSRDDVSPLTAPPANNERLIDPASPVLGPRLLARIRADDRAPSEILASLDADYPTWQTDLLASTVAYTETLATGLALACEGKGPKPGSNDGGWREVEPACIPTQVLEPYHQDYYALAQELGRWAQRPEAISTLPKLARETADNFQSIRDGCGQAHTLRELAEGFEAMCHFAVWPSRKLAAECRRFTNLNLKILSPEFSYPRLQFAVNGFTQYVYDELLDRPDLPRLLDLSLAAEAQWLEQTRAGHATSTMTEFVEARLKSAGYSNRDTLLVLAYSTRNMPSLDIQYARNPRAALTLELYFWKFHAIREEVREKFTVSVFPGHAFARDADLYHYYTAALQACELHRAGFSSLLSETAAATSKVGYKAKKFVAAIELSKLVRGRTKYLRDLAKRQDMAEGIELGTSGAEHGAGACPSP